MRKTRPAAKLSLMKTYYLDRFLKNGIIHGERTIYTPTRKQGDKISVTNNYPGGGVWKTRNYHH